jgi:hypothetical protein
MLLFFDKQHLYPGDILMWASGLSIPLIIVSFKMTFNIWLKTQNIVVLIEYRDLYESILKLVKIIERIKSS